MKHSTYILTCTLFLLFGCYEKQEGCLEINATNFDAAADVECEDCCTFPHLRINFTHRIFDSLFVSYGTPYNIDDTQVVVFNSVRFYASAFHLKQAGEEYGVEDSINLTAMENGNEVTSAFEDNFTILDRNARPTTIDFGTVQGEGIFDSLIFNVGLNNTINTVIPDDITESDHPLGVQTDTMWRVATGYIMGKINMVIDTMANDTLLLEIYAPDLPVAITIPLDLMAQKGVDREVNLNLEYANLFQGIDFVANRNDPDFITTKIVENLANTFSSPK